VHAVELLSKGQSCRLPSEIPLFVFVALRKGSVLLLRVLCSTPPGKLQLVTPKSYQPQHILCAVVMRFVRARRQEAGGLGNVICIF
jgi:hypothetical protein